MSVLLCAAICTSVKPRPVSLLVALSSMSSTELGAGVTPCRIPQACMNMLSGCARCTACWAAHQHGVHRAWGADVTPAAQLLWHNLEPAGQSGRAGLQAISRASSALRRRTDTCRQQRHQPAHTRACSPCMGCGPPIPATTSASRSQPLSPPAPAPAPASWPPAQKQGMAHLGDQEERHTPPHVVYSHNLACASALHLTCAAVLHSSKQRLHSSHSTQPAPGCHSSTCMSSSAVDMSVERAYSSFLATAPCRGCHQEGRH